MSHEIIYFLAVTFEWFLQSLGGLLLTICLGLATYGLKTATRNSERIARLEAGQPLINDRLKRIEDKLDRLLEK